MHHDKLYVLLNKTKMHDALAHLVRHVEKISFQNLAAYDGFYDGLAQAFGEQQPVQQVAPALDGEQCCHCILF